MLICWFGDFQIHQLRKVLREFAYFTRISDEDLEKERKVVLEDQLAQTQDVARI